MGRREPLFWFQGRRAGRRATLTERDSKIYEDNDVEVFITGQDAYYEFEINVLNTIYEAFWIWKDQVQPGGKFHGKPEWNLTRHKTMEIDGIGGHVHPRGWRYGFLDWDYPGLKHAVHVDGTLNQRDDVDRGWTVELAFPWKGLELLADGRSLPPKDGDVWRIDCSRFQQVNKEGKRLDVEQARFLRFAHPGGFHLRALLRQSGGGRAEVKNSESRFRQVEQSQR